MTESLRSRIEKAWESDSPDLSCVREALEKLDKGELRTAEKIGGVWKVCDYLKKAILLYLKYTKARVIPGSECNFFDKVPLKTRDWSESDFINAGFRAVPGAIVRYSAYIAKNVVLMPCFVNVGAYIDEGAMIDTNSLVGSCAHIGKKCHIADGVTIGGVLEPLQAASVIIEDNCFIGAKSAVLEGVVVGEGSVIAAGTTLSASTKIVDRETGGVSYGQIPPYSVVVPGTYASKNSNICCAVIVKRADEKTRSKTSINELLRT
ncbi:MAG: 2,3,4,5-tetrahydropyridine-2,6-dicarboxylate N-succinyltransferase [Holosporaceae bacterium]|jgi:2,3,4,5-tetrahydropyridine-2-carboxylate N-succinyltransferase|nr:2,3,4,5-tetrahydropyridine-2,6-dicarboxylate N-succinyltransferase [Holosporaceae bacterium]